MPKASDLFQQRPTISVLIQGRSGSGKTEWCARSPMPIFALTEPQAIPTIAKINPNAQIILCNDYRDFSAFLTSAVGGAATTMPNGQPGYSFRHKGEEIYGQTLITDGASDLFESLKAKLKPGGVIKDQEWSMVYSEMRSVFHALRSLPLFNVVTTLLKETKGEDDNEPPTFRPLLQGQTRDTLAQWFTAAGVMLKVRGRGGDPEHGLFFQLPSNYETKPAPGFPPSVRVTRNPGETTLGSLMLHAFDGVPESQIPHAEGDSAQIVAARFEELARRAQQAEQIAQSPAPTTDQPERRRA